MNKGVRVRLVVIACLSCLLAALTGCVTEERPGAGQFGDTVRPLRVELGPDLTERLLTRWWKGKNLLMELKSPDEVKELVGAEAAKGLVDEVDFAKERVVFVARLTGDGRTDHEVRGAAGEPRVVFYVRPPAGNGPRTDIGRWGLDFFAVERSAAVVVEQGERRG